AFLYGDGGHLLQQRLADSQPAKLRMNEQILEINPRAAQPGGVVEEVEGKTRRLAVSIGYKAEIEGVSAKAVSKQVRFGGNDGLRCALIHCECANEPQNQRNICRGCGTNRGCHKAILGCDTGHTQPPARRTTMER